MRTLSQTTKHANSTNWWTADWWHVVVCSDKFSFSHPYLQLKFWNVWENLSYNRKSTEHSILFQKSIWVNSMLHHTMVLWNFHLNLKQQSSNTTKLSFQCQQPAMVHNTFCAKNGTDQSVLIKSKRHLRGRITKCRCSHTALIWSELSRPLNDQMTLYKFDYF